MYGGGGGQLFQEGLLADRYSGKKGMKRILGIGMKRERENWVSRKIFARNIMKT